MKRNARGFTLLEMLVVIVVISVVIGMITLVAGESPARQARQQALAVAQLLNTSRESAVLEEREYGVRLERESYQLLRFERSTWQPVGAPSHLPAGLFMTLEQEGRPLTLSDSSAQPQILLLSSDELSPFVLSFSSKSQRWLSLSCDGLSEPVIDEN
ncbi:type II secretion system minor pseudopilin GspH [Pseudomonas baetica]|uniref:type II secretion system minor pseudopilin GspH n=1 Tax=Pseudomonas baetica TaxID=674054 RepID=UPI00287165F3|nr:type II secretion system minor pseudopilin GspH [Pseudomonas baetica]MDR9860637.1 type II secretion system minor pseudopilin GspH [Pseudomonas baetica]